MNYGFCLGSNTNHALATKMTTNSNKNNYDQPRWFVMRAYKCESKAEGSYLYLGNIKDLSLQQIWDKSARVNQLRKLSIETDFPKCAVCEDRNYCSLCLIRNANESLTGDYKELNQYFCDVAKIKRRLIG